MSLKIFKWPRCEIETVDVLNVRYTETMKGAGFDEDSHTIQNAKRSPSAGMENRADTTS